MTLEEFDSLSMLYSIQELIAACRDSDVIAYGTGKVGKVLIPYLVENTNVKLRGVTNSQTTKEESGTFWGTNLSLRSVDVWHKQFPDATVLVTTSRPDLHGEIVEHCVKIGFHKDRIFCVREELEKEVLSICFDMIVPPKNQVIGSLILPNIRYLLVDMMCTANALRDTHKAAFEEFKGCNQGQSVVLVGAGPSLNTYHQLKGLIHIGVNSVFLKPGIELDYWFMRDYCGFQGRESKEENWSNKLKNYNFVKFFGVSEWSLEGRESFQIPESIIEENHGRRFFTTYKKDYIHCDLAHYPVMGLGSTIFAALHFALYTMPRQILLVGCDCSSAGHFDGTVNGTENWANMVIDSWKWVKKFVTRFYPGLEIISINPVGLKGVFRDVYTEDYLNLHPEIDSSKCEIFAS